MQLPEDVVTFVNEWFEKRGVVPLCPACGHSKKWQPSQYTLSPMITHELEIQEAPGVGPLFYVFIPLTCQFCGVVMLMNAGTMNGAPSYHPGPVIDAEDSTRPM